jgi:hypothetical protein
MRGRRVLRDPKVRKGLRERRAIQDLKDYKAIQDLRGLRAIRVPKETLDQKVILLFLKPLR